MMMTDHRDDRWHGSSSELVIEFVQLISCTTELYTQYQKHCWVSSHALISIKALLGIIARSQQHKSTARPYKPCLLDHHDPLPPPSTTQVLSFLRLFLTLPSPPVLSLACFFAFSFAPSSSTAAPSFPLTFFFLGFSAALSVAGMSFPVGGA